MADYRSEDLRKLHAEVNQLTNQRFLLTTLAVTVFGVVSAWSIPRPDPTSLSSTALAFFPYLGSTVLLILLFLLYLVSHTLKRTMRILTTYLEVFALSEWESDWLAYRADGYYAYTKIQAMFFMVLGLLGALFSFLLHGLPRRADVHSCIEWIVLLAYPILLLTYLLFVSGMGYWNWWDSEKTARTRWQQLKQRRDGSVKQT